ncbi:MarR family winged helix-turn-helix transcriptional regulator [Gemmobacter sp.]|uniref:MarR family winged helix-turn-helix transcriptional regulator n=1 Tax=Gemmobacter sp. TaxID=1898957 RepID=UPI002AFECDBA|nr:MarR family winged helix-turn-helix transcriptional regulator [Gemmobacter sp.]
MSADTPKDYVLDSQIGFLLRQATQRNSQIFQRHTFDDLTTTQFSALFRLVTMGECSQNELGRRTAMDVATIKGVVDRLRKKGYIATREDENDRRRTLLCIAPGHEGLRERLSDLGTRVTNETLGTLNAADRRQLLDLLGKII